MPADDATTPRVALVGVSVASTFSAPRSLNEPVVCCVLELEVDVAAGELAQRRAANERRAFDERPDAVGGGEDVGGAESRANMRSET